MIIQSIKGLREQISCWEAGMSTIEAYTTATSVTQGDTLVFCVNNSPNPGTSAYFTLDVYAVDGDYFSGTASPVFSRNGSADSHPYPPMAYASGCGWPESLPLPIIGAGWSSGLYLARVRNGDGAEATIHFVVKSSDPGSVSPILFCWPVTTCQAYNGIGGKSLYPTQNFGRYHKVSFDRPTDWESSYALPFWQWLIEQGYDVEACTSIDLHEDPDFLAQYQLVLSVGHDEYWSKEMRDNVETFVANGGNGAFFSGNTCWWQVRFEDDDRTMVCYKSALDDPLTGVDNERVTINWASAPVNRPENLLTGVSYRTGAQSSHGAPASASYQVQAADHWVFENTGVNNGDSFAAGGLGYETDAADLMNVGGVLRPTGRDGTPLNFLPLAVADLRAWRNDMDGGWATMGLYTNGGAVFTAGTIEWSNALGDPVAAQVTRNVLDRLSQPYPGKEWQLRANRQPGNEWEIIGPANDLVTLTGMIEGYLFAVNSQGDLLWRPANGENLAWDRIGDAQNVLALTAPLFGGVELLAATSDEVLGREPVGEDVPWHSIYEAPEGTVGLAFPNEDLYAVTNDGVLLTHGNAGWKEIGSAEGIVALAWWDSKLFAATSEGRLLAREAVAVDVTWEDIGQAPENTVALGAYYGALFAATSDGDLWWKAAVCEPAPLVTGNLLFYASSNGYGAAGLLDSKGYFQTSQVYPDPSAENEGLSLGWTHVVHAGNGRLLFYDSLTGKGAAAKLENDATLETIQIYPDPSAGIESFSPQWTHIVGLGNGQMLFYDARTGKGATGFLGDDGLFETWQQFPDPAQDNPAFSVGWSHVVGAKNRVLFYDNASGKGATGRVDDDGRVYTLQNYPDPAVGHPRSRSGGLTL
jgi:N,N-dimethylformamidase beta subunit-like protein